eukprot:1721413-Rhodomonas_salina.1
MGDTQELDKGSLSRAVTLQPDNSTGAAHTGPQTFCTSGQVPEKRIAAIFMHDLLTVQNRSSQNRRPITAVMNFVTVLRNITTGGRRSMEHTHWHNCTATVPVNSKGTGTLRVPCARHGSNSHTVFWLCTRVSPKQYSESRSTRSHVPSHDFSELSSRNS